MGETSLVPLPDHYQFQPCTESDLDEFGQVFVRSVGKDKPSAYFRYNHCANPIGPPIREKLLWQGEIVGSHTIRPILMSINGEVLRAGLTMDSFIAPPHRNRGLFSTLAAHTSELARARGMDIILGYANRNSIHAYQKYLGHTEPGLLRYIVLDSCNQPQRSDAKVFPQQLTDEVKQLISRDHHSELFPVSTVKSPDFVQWRYIDSPESSYLIVSDCRSYACFFKHYGEEAQLVDLFATRHADYDTVATACLGFAAQSQRRLSMWIAGKHPLYRAIRGHPHQVKAGPQHLHVIGFGARNYAPLYQLENWHYMMGDSDVF